jgi:opacity protein-like surface antigen
MMSKNWFVFAVAAMLSGSAFATENGPGGVSQNPGKGARVLEGAGIINVMGDDVQYQLAYGQFITDAIEIAAIAGLRDDDIYMSTELGARAQYNFVRDSAFVPFLSTGVAWADVEADGSNLNTDAAVFSVGGGVNYFIRDNVALALSGSYLVATDDIFVDSENGELNGDEFRVIFGVRFYFR